MEKWIASLFGRRVVWLRDFDGELSKHWAKVTPFGLSCRRYLVLAETHCLLLPDGSVRGPSFVDEWRPA